MKKVYVQVQVKLVLKVEEGADISDVIDEMDYNFESVNPNAVVYDSTIEGFSVSGEINE
jgi:hypothetical protein